MKELSIEEKAKRYDNSLERANKIINDKNASSVWKGWLYNCFPELKDSEDEIRKEIISALKFANFKGVYDKHLAWLEKQGEKSIIIDVDKMVLKYSQTMDGDFGLPINCQIRAYRQGINDTLRLEKQGDQKPYGQREECSDCQVNYAGECKGSCELKRNEHKPQRIISAEVKETMYDKPTWSEEDNIILSRIIADYERSNEEWFNAQKSLPHGRKITWLKSLKDRVQPQSQWKPSDEQIGVIEAVINNTSFQRRHLDSLYEQLKKLKGE